MKRVLVLTLCASFCLLSLAPLLPGDEQEVPAYSPEVQAKLEELRARGEPVTLEDLAQEPIPPEENAATIYRRAFAAYVDRDEKVTQLISLPFQDRSTEQLQAVRAWVGQNQRTIVLLREASKLRRCQFLDRYTGGDQEIPHLNQLRQFSFLLGESIWLHLLDGDPEAAVEDCRLRLRLAEHLGQGTMLVQAVLECALVVLAHDSLQHVLASPEAERLDLRSLAEAVIRMVQEHGFRGALLGERVMLLDVLNRPEALKLGPESVKFLKSSPSGKAWLEGEKLRFLEGLGQTLALAERPWYESEKGRKELDAWLDHFQNEPPSGLFVVLLMPGITQTLSVPATREANLLEMALGIELELHRRKAGAYPDALSDLRLTYLEELPLDPFSGRVFVYRRDEDGYILYSVGRNGKDEGGAPRSRGGQEPDDIPWSVSLEEEE